MFTKRFPVRYRNSTTFAPGSCDSSGSDTVVLKNALAAPAMMVGRFLTMWGARYPAKISVVFLLGAVTVYVYSSRIASSAGIDETLLDLILFGAAAVSSIGGFAFSALCGAVLFHTPMDHIEVVQTMLMSSIAIQLLMITIIWKSIDWRQFCRFLIGGLIGIPFGLFILLHVERHLFAAGFGALLCAYSAYVLLRPPVVVSTRLAWLDIPIGFAGGITGGAVAFPGAPVTAWCQLKGWTRDQQRGIYQPFILAMQIASLSLMSLLAKPTGSHRFVLHHLRSVPPALVGALVGIYIYRKSTDRTFSIVINATLFVSGSLCCFENGGRRFFPGSPCHVRSSIPPTGTGEQLRSEISGAYCRNAGIHIVLILRYIKAMDTRLHLDVSSPSAPQPMPITHTYNSPP